MQPIQAKFMIESTLETIQITKTIPENTDTHSTLSRPNKHGDFKKNNSLFDFKMCVRCIFSVVRE